MVLARHIQPALFAAGAVLSFLAQVEATSSSSSFSFSKCVDSCIYGSGCSTSDGKCMCNAAKLQLLDNVAICMYHNCPDQIRSFESSFLDPIVEGCKEIKKSIPEKKIQEAEDTADTFADKLPPLTTSKTPTTSAKPTRQTTVTTSETKKPAPATTTTTQSAETESSTQSASSVDEDSTTTTTTPDATTPTTLALATETPTQTSSQSTTSTQAASNSEPTDSSPFATPPNAAGRAVTPWILASLPLALAIMIG